MRRDTKEVPLSGERCEEFLLCADDSNGCSIVCTVNVHGITNPQN